jgi:hypothetical protein
MANLEFFGVYGDAHTESDTGGDFYIAKNFDITFLENVWYFPVWRMINFYQEKNFTSVTFEKIMEGKWEEKELGGREEEGLGNPHVP